MMSSATTAFSLRTILAIAADLAGFTRPEQGWSGLSAAAKALAIAAAAGERPILAVVPADRDIEPLVANARFFLRALARTADDAAEPRVLPFPSPEVDPYRGLAPHFDVAAARARALHALASRRAQLVVASTAALLPRLVAPDRLMQAVTELRPEQEIAPSDLADRLVTAGFSREDPVDQHGEFYVRGGVVDVFPAGDRLPIRLEFVGDTVESIRAFDPETQRSVSVLEHVRILPLTEQLADDSGAASTTVFDYAARADAQLVVLEWTDVDRLGQARAEGIASSYRDAVARGDEVLPVDRMTVAWSDVAERLVRATRLETLGLDDLAAPTPPEVLRHVRCQPSVHFHGRVSQWVEELVRAREMGETTVLVAETSGRAERVIELLREHGLVAEPVDETLDGAQSRAEAVQGAHDVAPRPPEAPLLVVVGDLSEGFRLPEAKLRLYAETDVFDEERVGGERRRRITAKGETRRSPFLSDFRDLRVGDFVVHIDNGVGRFVGLRKIDVSGEAREFMELRYAGEDKLFVPVDRLDLVQKHTGGGRPVLDRLGGASWEKTKTRVKRAMRDMAEELLKLYAARNAIAGHTFSGDTHWQQEFEDAFPYELTVDQRSAITDIKRDMEAPTPMDRLLCGDVGYGKTEVAMRAAFKAVMDGKQVAFLAPTTVLALQHLRTLTSRFAAFPARIDMVSRFRSRAEQKATLAGLADGRVDVIVGTHRLLSKDVVLRDLGLLIVDEEQRFGVVHKERLKQLRKRVDVLTMTATPIPRTLNMSLVGIRDMSIIETPPKDRQAIQTHVTEFDARILASAVQQELERGGQVYVVHNRVESIYSFAQLIQRLVPDARVGVGHGQMEEAELERVMVGFVDRKFDVLVSTTIVENGLDIPNANTLIVNRADRYGLAQLYQLRGRVGRSDRRAYAYLVVPPADTLSDVARRRLAAIREFSDLGAGFRVAALDLEIRGAGNLLGGEQSGHIEAVGFEMYTKLLEEAVRALKGEELEDDRRTALNLKMDIRIDESYIEDMNQRLSVYRRIASARSLDELERVLGDVRDRYGPPPAALSQLAACARLRIAADRLRVESIDREASAIVLKFRSDAPIEPGRLVRLMGRRPDVRLVPPGLLRLELAPPSLQGRTQRHVPDRSVRGAPAPATASRVSRASGDGQSWWTARAREADVRAGFSKAEVTRRPAEDPLAPGGVVARVEQLLVELEEAAVAG
ncbi:MAG: transcription-repair coupling factor [Luteitalea sp.]|nr:transcription-repair coupling factor [Luteitalea sp.]